MENRLKELFNYEFLSRFLSAIIFIPLVIFPIFSNNYLLYLVFLIFNSIILVELSIMRTNKVSSILINSYIPIVTFSFFIFVLILITIPSSKVYMIEIILTIWLFDTFSYLGGKIIGGTKLVPKISSGKTYSGLISGLLFSVFIIQIIKINYSEISILSFLFSIFVVIASFIGDLYVSIIKRSAEVKDSGDIMPGHGGLLDRFDSFISVMFFLGIIKIVI